MSIKKLIALITAISILTLSFGTVVSVSASTDLPTATVNAINYSAYELKGVYDFNSPTGANQGVSEFKWYASDTMFGAYQEISGQTEQTLPYGYYTSGQYIKFEVTPKDEFGTEGPSAMSEPLHITTIVDEFNDSSSLTKINMVENKSEAGEFSIAQDPKNPKNNVLKIDRNTNSPDTSKDMTMVSYDFTNYETKGAVIEADVYVDSSLKGKDWELLYIMGQNASNKLAQVAKLQIIKDVVKFSGVSSYDLCSGIDYDKWYHIKVVLDFEKDVVKEVAFGDNVKKADVKFVKSADIKYVDFVRSYMQKENSGIGYIDNMAYTPIHSSTGYAQVDAESLIIDTTVLFDTTTIELPSTGATHGSGIGWKSSNKSIIEISGNTAQIKRDPNDLDNKNVTLTACVINGSDIVEVPFEMTVICSEPTDVSIEDVTIPVVGDTVSENFEVITILSDDKVNTPDVEVIWTSSDTSLIKFSGSTAIVKRPYTEKTVTITATAVINGVTESKIFTLKVEPKSLDQIVPPEAKDIKIVQKPGTRPVVASYTYYDQGAYDEFGSEYKWYVETQPGVYEQIEGKYNIMFVPSSEYDGKNIRFSVVPKSEIGKEGEETFSAPIKYSYFQAKKPVAKIIKSTITEDHSFEIDYSYNSPDFIDEGETIITWYKSATMFGDYQEIDDAEDVIYTPEDKDAFYKVRVTPVDIEENVGTYAEIGPFMYASPNANAIVISKEAVSALSLPLETYHDLQLPVKSADGATYTWVSSNEDILTSDGKITRPDKDHNDSIVAITAYAVCAFEIQYVTFNLRIKKYTNIPVASGQTLKQNPGRRPIIVDYDFTDEDGNKEGTTKYEWFIKNPKPENGPDNEEFRPFNLADSNIYAPTSDLDKCRFKVRITPVDDSYTEGVPVETEEYEYTYYPPMYPTAIMGKTDYKAYELTGNYEYANDDAIAEGNTKFEWYVSDELFGTYEKIEGQTEKTLKYDNYKCGQYVKFVVIPEDKDGLKGESYEANPVLISSNVLQTFDDESSFSSIDSSTFAKGSGSYTIVKDPAKEPLGESNTALKIERTVQTDPKLDHELSMSMVRYNFPGFSNPVGVILDFDVYVDSSIKDNEATWELMYVYGSAMAFKMYTNKNNHLYYQGSQDKSVSSIKNKLTKDKWHHIKVVFDLENQLIREVVLDDEVGDDKDLPFRSSTYTIDNVRSYMQDMSLGCGYIDNLSLTPITSTKNYALEDANMIKLDTELDAVIGNIKLPTVGSENGSSITWVSSDENYVVIEDGKRAMVTRPTAEVGDKKVIITAYAVKGNDYYSRDFELNIVRVTTDDDVVKYDKERLDEYDNYITDTQISFPLKGKFGSYYTWESTNTSVIKNDGTVIPTKEKQDVVFNVKIESGKVYDYRQITITVAPEVKSNLLINGGVDTSSANSNHPTVYAGDNDYSTYWQCLSQDKTPFVILDMGKTQDVNRVFIADKAKSIKSVKLSGSKDKTNWSDITVTKNVSGDNISVVEFATTNTRYVRLYLEGDGVVSVNEFKLMYDADVSGEISSDVINITLPVGSTVSSDFEVPTALSDGTPITWTSSNTSLIEFVGSKADVHSSTIDKSVTITATVTVNGVPVEKTFALVVEGKNGDGGAGGAGKKNDVSTVVGGTTSAIIPSTSGSRFADVSSVPWAIDAINDLASKGVVNGTSSTTFEPARSITREEFAAILYRGLGLDSASAGSAFADVKSGAWYYTPVMKLSSLGIIKGVGDGYFGTGRTITRQDMAVMIYNAAIAKNAQFASNGINFADEKHIAEYAKKAVEALSSAQIINGVGNGNFNPAGNATRAEATVILSRIINYIK